MIVESQIWVSTAGVSKVGIKRSQQYRRDEANTAPDHE
jgi:hypothetical protein